MPARRRFLKTIGGLAAGSLITPLASRAAASALAAPGMDEEYWRLVKAEFPVRPGLAMMNAANLCPAPYAVTDAVMRWTRFVNGDASFQNRAAFSQTTEEARRKIADLVGVDPSEIALTRNTSEGNNTVARGVRLNPGDEVVIWDENHPTNSLAWDVRAEREGFRVIRVSVEPNGDRSAPFLDAITSRTRVLAFSHLSNVSGTLLPAAELCTAARSRGIVTLVDGAQTFGMLNLDLHAMGCDFFASSAHKWFMGPKECGILYARSGSIEQVAPNDVGVGYTEDQGALKFESLGQRDDACIAAMGTAADFHATIGLNRIEARVHELGDALVAGIRRIAPDAEFSTPADPAARSGVVIFSIPGHEGMDLFQRLYAEHQVAGAPSSGGIRLSPHIYNTMDDVEQALNALEVLAG